MNPIVASLLVGVGGFFGSLARYLMGTWIHSALGVRFPTGTLLVNVSGAFLLGLVATILAERASDHTDTVRLLVGVGFLGGYTTFSTLCFETYDLAREGDLGWAIANVVLSIGLGLLAIHLGLLASRRWH